MFILEGHAKKRAEERFPDITDFEAELKTCVEVGGQFGKDKAYVTKQEMYVIIAPNSKYVKTVLTKQMYFANIQMYQRDVRATDNFHGNSLASIGKSQKEIAKQIAQERKKQQEKLESQIREIVQIDFENDNQLGRSISSFYNESRPARMSKLAAKGLTKSERKLYEKIYAELYRAKKYQENKKT